MLWERVYSDIPRWWLHPWSVGPFNNLLFAHYKTCHHHHTVKCSGGGVQRVWVRLWAEPFLRTLEGSGETEVRERVYISNVLPAALLQGSGRLTSTYSWSGITRELYELTAENSCAWASSVWQRTKKFHFHKAAITNILLKLNCIYCKKMLL